MHDWKELSNELLDLTEELVQMVDAMGRFVYVNAAWTRNLGWTREEANKLHFTDILDPALLPHCLAMFQEISKGASFKGIEVKFRTKEGRTILLKGSVGGRFTNGVFTHTNGFFTDVTAQREQEERLRRSEERFQELFAANPVAMIYCQSRGRIIDANKQFSELFGVPREQAIGQNSMKSEFWVTANRSTLLELLRQHDRVDGFETRLRTKDGRDFDALLSAQRLRLENQTSIVVSIMDISERRRAARESLEKDRLLRLVIDLVPHFIFAQDAQSRFIFVNRALAKAWGISSEQMVGRENNDFPSSLFQIEQSENEKEPKAIRQLVEHRFLDSLGQNRRLQTQAIPFEVPVTGEKAFLGVSVDVTQILEAEETARASEERKTAVLESSLDGIVTIDSDGNIVEWNRAAERIFGFADGYAIGKPLDELVIPERYRSAHRNGVRKVTLSSEGAIMHRLVEMPAIRSDGTEFPIELYVVPTRTNPPLYTGFIRDISERKRAEQAQSKLEAHLRQVQKLEAMGTLAGGIAHDFNNILAAILSNAELGLLEATNNQACHGCLSEIQTAALRAKGLTQQILTFSRVQRSSERLVAVDAGPVIAEAIRMLRATIPSGIQLQSRIDSASFPVGIDPTHLHQLVINLGTNAWHAVEATKGQIRVCLSAERVGPDGRNIPLLKPGDYMSLSVEDTGPGMDKATKERIFEPFFTTKVTGKGTGLGLSVVQGIVRQAGGSILVESAPGKGATFQILLPMAREVTTAPIDSPSQQSSMQSARLLVIDDEESLLKVTCKLLNRAGYEVEGLTDSSEALKRFSDSFDTLDLMITDHNMPGTSGLGMSEKFLQVRPDLPIILLTGELTEDIQERAKRVGIAAVIQKPINIAALSNTIQELLQRR